MATRRPPVPANPSNGAGGLTATMVLVRLLIRTVISLVLLGFAYLTRHELEGLAGVVVGYVAGYWLPGRPRETLPGSTTEP